VVGLIGYSLMVTPSSSKARACAGVYCGKSTKVVSLPGDRHGVAGDGHNIAERAKAVDGQAAKEFLASLELPPSIRWFEL
jgi:hypothetical protein